MTFTKENVGIINDNYVVRRESDGHLRHYKMVELVMNDMDELYRETPAEIDMDREQKELNREEEIINEGND